jgi:hypothetical protein
MRRTFQAQVFCACPDAAGAGSENILRRDLWLMDMNDAETMPSRSVVMSPLGVCGEPRINT